MTAHNKLMELSLKHQLLLYLDGKVANEGGKAISPFDAYRGLAHACLYGPTTIDKFHCNSIVYSQYPTKSAHTSFVFQGKRVKAEKQTIIISGDAEIMRPLLYFLQLFPCSGKMLIEAHPKVRDHGWRGSCLRHYEDPSAHSASSWTRGSIHSYEELSYLPALLLNDLDFMSDYQQEVLGNYGIDGNLITKLVLNKHLPGSWLNIVAAVELWMEGQSSLKEALEAI